MPTSHIPSIHFAQQHSRLKDFEIFSLESLYERHIKQDPPDKPHRIKFFLMIYIAAGRGKHMIDFVEYDFQPGSFIFVQREQVQAFDFKTQPEWSHAARRTNRDQRS